MRETKKRMKVLVVLAIISCLLSIEMIYQELLRFWSDDYKKFKPYGTELGIMSPYLYNDITEEQVLNHRYMEYLIIIKREQS